MRWEKKSTDWHRKFAWLPECYSSGGGMRSWFWLEHYEQRFCGDHYEMRLLPRKDQTDD